MFDVSREIIDGHTSLGIELGSTRIKAVLIDRQKTPVASGSFEWENQLVDGIWTYDLDQVWSGIQAAYADLVADVWERYKVGLTKIGSMGISAMMHGYMVFDDKDNLLVPFRTWRNTMTACAAEELSELFQFNIPERWSIAHLYQAILNDEPHLQQINFLTTLAGYVHWQLTNERVLGIGDASGIFPIDSKAGTYRLDFINSFELLTNVKNYPIDLKAILPRVLRAGQKAGNLTEKGAKLLDPSGQLEAGVPMCPPEGDAGTGMVATNSIAPKTGNISAGTSIFSMVVLEKGLSKRHPEIDIVTTPVGDSVAMVHANNCSTEINAWVKLFHEFSQLTGQEVSLERTYQLLFHTALEADKDCGQILSIGYHSGESITGVNEGRPMLIRLPESRFNVGNLMRSQLFSAFATLSLGMGLLIQEEGITIDCMLGHGGVFKTPIVAQSLLAAAIDTPVSVMETAGEGGAWGIALLADYLHYPNLSLVEYLEGEVFGATAIETVEPLPEDIVGFGHFIESYKAGIEIEKLAVKQIQ